MKRSIVIHYNKFKMTDRSHRSIENRFLAISAPY